MTAKTPAERDVQAQLLAQLRAQGYQELQGTRDIEDHRELFKQELERLNGFILSPTEFERLTTRLHAVSMGEAFDMLRNGVELPLDDNSIKVLRLMSSVPSENHFQVAEEVEVKALVNRRLDVVIFMNGLPILAGELKRTGVGIEKALEDVNTYSREGIYRVGLLRFIQLYFVSDGATSKYFSTSLEVEQGGRYTSAFYWLDEENKRIKQLLKRGIGSESWVETFFKQGTLFKLLTQGMLKRGGRRPAILVLRPYQLYAVRAGLQRALHSSKNGFFWHATGSGKTLTSYMLAQAIASSSSEAKVIMLLDRNDLADQTMEEFNDFSGRRASVVKGSQLVKTLNDEGLQIALTTLQSFQRLVVKDSAAKRKRIKTLYAKKVYFIVDECHRTTFGKMFKDIRNAFPEAQFFGFTGTPIMEENKATGDRVTKDIFGDPIHVYTIKNAIDDKSVLPFLVSEVKVSSNRSLAVIKQDEAAWQARRGEVASYIAQNLFKHTQQTNKHPQAVGGKQLVKSEDNGASFTAMLATPSIHEAYSYWELLAPRLAAQERTCAVVFSFGAEKDDEENGKTYLPTVLAAYDKQFGTAFGKALAEGEEATGDVAKKYIADVARRVRTKEIDLVVVAYMLLTGFDSPGLNTIYLDKQLKTHGLLQAMSRTNRLSLRGDKPYGNVVLFSDRALLGEIDTTVRLFSYGRGADGVIRRRDYAALLQEVKTVVTTLHAQCSAPSAVDEVDSVKALKELLHSFTALRRGLHLIKTYDEWEDSEGNWLSMGTTEAEVDEYWSAILDAKSRLQRKKLKNEEELTELEALSLKIEGEKKRFAVDVSYINELLRNVIFAPEDEKLKWANRLRRALEESEDPEVLRHRDSLEATLGELIKGGTTITTVEELFEELERKKAAKREERLETHGRALGITREELEWLVSLQSDRGEVPVAELDGMLKQQGLTIRQRRELKERLASYLNDLVR